MTTAETHQIIVLPEYEAIDLGVPFKVLLIDSVKQLVDEKTGEVERVIIPNFRGLIKCVATTRILAPRKLSGIEIKFIRKAFKLPSKAVAEMIGVTPEHLSRCESTERVLSESAEKCFRVSVFLEQFKILEQFDSLCEKNDDLHEKMKSLREAISKVGSIINDMRISAAFDSEEPLVFSFSVYSPTETDLFDDPNADWHSDDHNRCIAA